MCSSDLGAVAGGSPRALYRSTSLWWGLWLAYLVLSNVVGRLAIQEGMLGRDTHQGVVPGLEIAVAIAGILAFAAWVPVVRGLSQAQSDLAAGR